MRVSMIATLLLGVAVFSAAPQAQAQAQAPRAQTEADLNGEWLVSFNTPMGTMDGAATFKQEGEELSGVISGPTGETAFKGGSVKAGVFTFTFDIAGPNGNLSIIMNGEQAGDAIKGTFDFGQGTGDWTGKRKS